MNFRYVLKIIGGLLIALGITMAVPALIDFYSNHPNWPVFSLCALATLIAGLTLYLTAPGENAPLNIFDSYLLTFISWLLISIFGALPLFFSQESLSWTDAFFESVSGLTTTGATIFTGIDSLPPGILMWRSILQWIGGIGIVVLAISLLPSLGTGVGRIFHMESSDQSEQPAPRMKSFIQALVQIYTLLTLLCALGYYLTGMSPFEAVAHSLTTLSTGGFSTSDASFGHFTNPGTHWVAIVFMVLGSLPYLLYYRAARGNWEDLVKDDQVRFFLAFLGISTAILTLSVWQQDNEPPFEAFQHVLFHVTSIVTTTGYTTTDYSVWGTLAFETFFLFLFVGGCSGSTASGIKMFRFQIILRMIQIRFKQLLHPHVIVTPKFNGKSIEGETREAVALFFCLYIFFSCAVALSLSTLGLDFITSASAAATAITNVGPGLGSIVGPVGNFQPLPDTAKWILSFAMLAGRLELFTVFIIFTPAFWKR